MTNSNATVNWICTTSIIYVNKSGIKFTTNEGEKKTTRQGRRICIIFLLTWKKCEWWKKKSLLTVGVMHQRRGEGRVWCVLTFIRICFSPLKCKRLIRRAFSSSKWCATPSLWRSDWQNVPANVFFFLFGADESYGEMVCLLMMLLGIFIPNADEQSREHTINPCCGVQMP